MIGCFAIWMLSHFIGLLDGARSSASEQGLRFAVSGSLPGGVYAIPFDSHPAFDSWVEDDDGDDETDREEKSNFRAASNVLPPMSHLVAAPASLIAEIERPLYRPQLLSTLQRLQI